MKISKILAGFSAAALAASMMSMVSFAEDADDVRVAPAMGSIWNGEEGVEITDYEFAEWGGAWVQVDLVAPDGFEVDTSDAMFVVEMVSTKDVSKDDQLFRYIDTEDGTEFVATADQDYAAGETIVQVADFDELAAAVGAENSENSWGTGFGMSMQFCLPVTASVYAAGFDFVEEEDTGDIDYSCGCTAETCKYWDAEKNQCGCGCHDEAELTATLGFAANWFPQDWVSSVDITGDGEYSIKMIPHDETGAELEEIPTFAFWNAESDKANQNVFVVDIPNVYDGPEGTKDADGKKYSEDNVRNLIYPDVKITLEKLLVNGQEIEFDASKIKYGNIENDKTNYRIEIYNEYGDTKADPAFDLRDLTGEDLEVVFTVEGLSKPCICDEETDESSQPEESKAEESKADESKAADSKAADSKAASASTTTNPSTGTAALAVVGIALAGASAVAAKKRK